MSSCIRISLAVAAAVWIVTCTVVGDVTAVRPGGVKVAEAPEGRPVMANVTGPG
jgi:hypothetical protein